MSIVYMKALEAEPSKFDEAFQKLSPAVKEAYDHVLETIRAIQKEEPLHILEIGSGTGHLSRQITREFDCSYTGIDISPAMVDHAESMKSSEDSRTKFIADNFLHMDLQRLESQEFDIIVSTFTLSELRIVEKRLFLQRIHQLLAKNGIAIIADETVPQGLRRATFGLKHFIYAQLALLKVGKTTYPLKALPQQLQEEGLAIFSQKKLTGSAQVWNVRKEDKSSGPPVGSLRAALGKLVWLKVGYSALNGVMTRKAVKPGLYSIGSPDTTSPVIVTANYYWTVARVSKRLLGH
ncbi:MAG: methyltransferase domain-containing protein [Candidatus Hodarchaeales archaeon]|jgi:ubiquinone/menaquinone biosynthesis C-methylase UbiE